jgi:hypothetical protein
MPAQGKAPGGGAGTRHAIGRLLMRWSLLRYFGFVTGGVLPAAEVVLDRQSLY